MHDSPPPPRSRRDKEGASELPEQEAAFRCAREDHALFGEDRVLQTYRRRHQGHSNNSKCIEFNVYVSLDGYHTTNYWFL